MSEGCCRHDTQRCLLIILLLIDKRIERLHDGPRLEVQSPRIGHRHEPPARPNEELLPEFRLERGDGP